MDRGVSIIQATIAPAADTWRLDRALADAVPTLSRERLKVLINAGQVTRDGAPLDKLNELDCTDGHIYANRFLTSEIVRIDAASGNVTDTIDASTLASNAAPDPNNVLNGIAHIPGTDHFLVGGKRWPQLYEVRFVPQ